VLTEEELRGKGVLLLPTPRELPAIRLIRDDGTVFDNTSLVGGWSFIFFGFTNCPDICPTTMAVLGQARQRLGELDAVAADDFQGILVSVDPERDSAEVLGEYARAFSPSFFGVRGSVTEVAEMATSVNVAFAKVPSTGEDGALDADNYTVDHSANIIIINPRGHYHGFIKYPQQADTIVAAMSAFVPPAKRCARLSKTKITASSRSRT
jgi:protein SCO1/2